MYANGTSTWEQYNYHIDYSDQVLHKSLVETKIDDLTLGEN